MTTTTIRPNTLSPRRRALATGGAVLATALLWAVAHILGVELRVDTRTGLPALAVTLPLVSASTLAASLLAIATRQQLHRWTDRASTAWIRLAITVLLVSLTPLAYVQASGAAKAILAAMHLAVAAVLIPLLAHANGSAIRDAGTPPCDVPEERPDPRRSTLARYRPDPTADTNNFTI
jgi:hypothetical protein